MIITTQVGPPDLIMVQRLPNGSWRPPGPSGVSVDTEAVGKALRVDVAAAEPGTVSRVQLRWRRRIGPGTRVLGDAWERSYGDLQWRGLQPELLLPWSVVGCEPTESGSSTSWGIGVEVRGGAFAGWTVDPEGVSLWLDLRSGGGPVHLGDRTITAAVVHRVDGAPTPYAAQCALATALCPDPLPVGPLVGCNNWYYAYGRGFDAAAVVRDAGLIAELVGDHPVRPFGVVDDGWVLDGIAEDAGASAGPWDRSRTPQFPDMAELAASVASLGVRPGIWFRPLLRREPLSSSGATVPARPWDGQLAMDPSHPTMIATVEEDVARIRSWGFELIKHDFSSYEALGRWGFQMGSRPAADEIEPYDTHRTTAEVLVDFYRAVRRGAGNGIVLGCNVVGHLAAGLVEAQRTGDDTSGRVWERTRRMGVNTLAFRLAQHRRFFTMDADCVASTPQTDWSLNRQFLDLIARSGTALFVSVDPATRSEAVDADLSTALRLALDGGVPGGVEPLDWMDTTTPQRWRSGEADGREVRTYRWYDERGGDPFVRTDADPTEDATSS